MDHQRVRELFTLLPPGAAYPSSRRSPFAPARQEPSEIWAKAVGDPAFGHVFVQAHLKTGHWLPDTIREWPLVQSFAVRWFEVTEPLMLEVESFRTDIRRHDRNLLDALLLADDASLADIAGLLHTSEEVIEAYEVLFWNVRDRKREKPYLAALLYPEGWQAAARDPRPDATGDRLRLLRAGAERGKSEVLLLAGLSPRHRVAETLGDATQRFDKELQADAEDRWRAGARMVDPVIKAMHQTSLRHQERTSNEDPLALHNINAVHPVLDELKKYNSFNSPPPPSLRAKIDKQLEENEIQRMLRQSAVKPRE